MWYECFEFETDPQAREAFVKISRILVDPGTSASAFLFTSRHGIEVTNIDPPIHMTVQRIDKPNVTVFIDEPFDMRDAVLGVMNRSGGVKANIEHMQFIALLAARASRLADGELHTIPKIQHLVPVEGSIHKEAC